MLLQRCSIAFNGLIRDARLPCEDWLVIRHYIAKDQLPDKLTEVPILLNQLVGN